MSRAIMITQIEAIQERAEADWERATPEQQAAALEREAEIVAQIAPSDAPDDDPEGDPIVEDFDWPAYA